jgi:hypothetical protein
MISKIPSRAPAASFFPKGYTPAWQIFVGIKAVLVVMTYVYADRLKNRGYTDADKRVLEVGYYILGAIAVFTVFALVYASIGGI